MGIKDKTSARKCEREIEKWLKKIDKLDKEIDELAKLRNCKPYNENVSSDNNTKSNDTTQENTTDTVSANKCNSEEASINSDNVDSGHLDNDNTTEYTNFQNISDFVKQQIKLDRTVVSNAMGKAVDTALFKLGISNDAIRIAAANTIISLQISNAINDITDIKGNSVLIRAFGEQVNYSSEIIDAIIELVNSIDLNKLSEYTNEELANDNIVAPILEKYEKKSDKETDKSSMDFSKMVKPIRLGMDFSEFIKSNTENQSEVKAS